VRALTGTESYIHFSKQSAEKMGVDMVSIDGFECEFSATDAFVTCPRCRIFGLTHTLKARDTQERRISVASFS